MTQEVTEIVRRAEEQGIQLRVVGDRVRYGPKSTAPAELVEELRAHRAEVLEYLSARDSDMSPRDVGGLLNWASELSQRDLVLQSPVRFVEAPLRVVTTGRASHYAGQYLKTIASARLNRGNPGLCLQVSDGYLRLGQQPLKLPRIVGPISCSVGCDLRPIHRLYCQVHQSNHHCSPDGVLQQAVRCGMSK